MTGDHRKLLTDYIFQLTAEEQRRVAASMPRAKAAVQPSTNRKQAAVESHPYGERGFAVEFASCGLAKAQDC